MVLRYTVSVALCACVSLHTARAQQQPGPPSRSSPPSGAKAASGAAEAKDVSAGWAHLAAGRIEQAASVAEKLLTTNPRHAAGLLLSVEAELARADASAALTQYERWVGARTFEEPAILRRVAQGALQEAAAQGADAIARLEALRGLAASGDPAAIAELERAASAGSSAEARVLASIGNKRGVIGLIDALKTGSGNPALIAHALGDSGSAAAVGPLLARLDDAKDETRAAVAQALGKLGDATLIARLKPMLSDKSPFVRLQAAGALYRLGDESGVAFLQELLAQPLASMRLAAAEAMASRPDAAWLSLVRDLVNSQEPEVRAGAARLIAPHDPALARSVLESLMTSPNPAIREFASQTAVEDGPGDLTTLRRLMRSTEKHTRIRAAGRVAQLTR